MVTGAGKKPVPETFLKVIVTSESPAPPLVTTVPEAPSAAPKLTTKDISSPEDFTLEILTPAAFPFERTRGGLVKAVIAAFPALPLSGA